MHPTAMRARSALILLLATSGCRRAHSSQPRDELPAPFATRSVANPARLVPRPAGAAPRAANGAAVRLWARHIGGVRTVAQAPSGEVFGVDRGGAVVLFTDPDGDGEFDGRETFADGLDLPFGIAFHPAGWLYVGATDALWRYRYRPGMRRAEGPPTRLLSLPRGGHWTRNVAISPDGARVFVSIGSGTNVDPEPDPRATIVRAAADGTGMTVFARGLRNPVGLAFAPDGRLFTVVNERDELGDELPPDYLTAVREGAHYGWPYAYWGPHPDPRLHGERMDIVERAVRPDVSLGAHAAPIGLVFPTRGALGVPPGDALVSLHGSWNRAQPRGYKVVRVRFQRGAPVGPPEDFVTGWLQADGTTWGRPAGMCELTDGSLLIVDDGAGSIWRVVPPAR